MTQFSSTNVPSPERTDIMWWYKRGTERAALLRFQLHLHHGSALWGIHWLHAACQDCLYFHERMWVLSWFYQILVVKSIRDYIFTLLYGIYITIWLINFFRLWPWIWVCILWSVEIDSLCVVIQLRSYNTHLIAHDKIVNFSAISEARGCFIYKHLFRKLIIFMTECKFNVRIKV